MEYSQTDHELAIYVALCCKYVTATTDILTVLLEYTNLFLTSVLYMVELH